MKLSVLRPVLTSVLGVSCFCCGFADVAEQIDALTGNYLYDGMHFDAVFYTIVYEEDGRLFALNEMADYPVEMKKIKSDPPVYRIKFRSKGDFHLTFSDLKDGRFNTLSMASNDSEFQMNGFRSKNDIHKLRDYQGWSRKRYSYKVPLQLGDGLETGNILETGIDTASVNAMMNDVLENYDYMHSILVIKDGKLVIEEYFNGWDPVRIHRLQSVTKSVTSTLVGFALDQRYIDDISDPVYKYLPAYDSLLTGAKKEITIEHLLTMSAGFKWNEVATYYAAPESCDAHLAGASGNFIGYVLEKPLINTPGEYYEYNSGFPNILGHIIADRSGMRILEFSFKYLFGPLGVERAYWSPTGGEKEYRPGCAGGLRLTSRDMAKYGFLYLNNGTWNGKQIVDSDWARESMEGKIDSRNNTRYGYLWKSTRSLDGRYEIFFASGTGGQYIALVPELNSVVVTTARYSTDKSDAVAMLLLDQLVPALYGG